MENKGMGIGGLVGWLLGTGLVVLLIWLVELSEPVVAILGVAFGGFGTLVGMRSGAASRVARSTVSTKR